MVRPGRNLSGYTNTANLPTEKTHFPQSFQGPFRGTWLATGGGWWNSDTRCGEDDARYEAFGIRVLPYKPGTAVHIFLNDLREVGSNTIRKGNEVKDDNNSRTVNNDKQQIAVKTEIGENP